MNAHPRQAATTYRGKAGKAEVEQPLTDALAKLDPTIRLNEKKEMPRINRTNSQGGDNGGGNSGGGNNEEIG